MRMSAAWTIHQERQVEIGTARESAIRNGGAEWIGPGRASTIFAREKYRSVR